MHVLYEQADSQIFDNNLAVLRCPAFKGWNGRSLHHTSLRKSYEAVRFIEHFVEEQVKIVALGNKIFDGERNSISHEYQALCT